MPNLHDTGDEGLDNLLAAAFSIGLIWTVTWINSRGARSSGLVAVVTTVLKLVPLAAVTFIGFFYMHPENLAAGRCCWCMGRACTPTLA